MKTKKINHEIIKSFCELYNHDKSLRTIAKEKKVSPNTVKKYLLLEGIKVKCKNIVYSTKTHDHLLNGLYLGIWAGDGTHYMDKGYRIKICCHRNNIELINFIQDSVLNFLIKKVIYK